MIMLLEVITKDGNRGQIETTVQPNRKDYYEEIEGVYFEKRPVIQIIKQKKEIEPKKEVMEVKKEEVVDIMELRRRYEEKHQKRLSPRYYNDVEWIVSKL